MTRTVRAVLGKEWREIWRDPLSLSLALVLPLILLLLFTYGLNLDTPHIKLGVQDLDNSATSRDYLQTLSASGDLVISATTTDTAELGALRDAGKIDAAVILPPDFERSLVAGQPAQVQILADGSYPPWTKAALAELDAAAEFYSHRRAAELGLAAPMSGPAVVPQTRVWFNPEMKSINYVVPGLFSLILMTLPPLLSTLAVVRERERGSIQQILVAPVKPVELILGKAIPYAVLAYAEMLIVLAAGLFWFRVPIKGSLPLLLLVSVIYVFCTVGIGLLISTVTRSQVVAMLLALVATLMPSFLFSGFLFPLYSMPVRYQVASQAFPARYFMEVSRSIALKAAGLTELWPQVLALLIYTAAVLLLAAHRFTRRMG